MPRYIDADALIDRMKKDPLFPLVEKYGVTGVIEAEPTADVRENVQGKWVEQKVVKDWCSIEEWQNAKCSVCGKYHTTPYMYYFDHYNYCPCCGARMEEKKDDD